MNVKSFGLKDLLTLLMIMGLLAVVACTSPVVTPATQPPPSPTTTPSPTLPTVTPPTAASSPTTTAIQPIVSPTAAPAATSNAGLSPSVRITSPRDIVKEGSVTVIVEVSGFEVVDQLGKPNVPGQGHIHYYLDVFPPTSPGQPAVTAAGTYAASSALFHTWNNVTAGNHTFYAQLVHNDHTPLNPPVVTQAAFVVTPAELNKGEGGQ